MNEFCPECGNCCLKADREPGKLVCPVCDYEREPTGHDALMLKLAALTDGEEVGPGGEQR